MTTPSARGVALLLGSSALGLAMTVGPTIAQDTWQRAADSGDTPTRLQSVVVETSVGEATAPVDTPASVSVIDGDELEIFGRGKLDDVLRRTPGTFTQTNPQQPGVAVNIRGLQGSGRVNSTIDGVRQSFRFNGHEASGFTYVDPNFVSMIDVRRGAVTTAGGGGLAGSVNFRTIGVDDIVAEGEDIGFLGRMGFGENGTDVSGMMAAGYRGESFGLALGISGRNAGDYENGHGDTEPDTGQELESGLFKAEADLGDGHRLSFGGLYYHNDFAANSYEQRIINRTATLGYRFDPVDTDLVDLSVNGYYNRITMEYLAPIDPTSPFSSAVGREIEDEGLGFDLGNVSHFTMGDIGVTSENGVEYFQDKVSSTNGGVNPADGKSKSFAIFTENTFTYGMFDLIGALRYDHYWLDATANAGPPIGPYTVDQSEGRLSPRITLAARVTDWLQPYATYSQSMRAPTLQETLVGGDHPGGTTSAAFLPNPDLEPEWQRGWEIGANVRREGLFTDDDVFLAKVSYYDMTIENYIAARLNPTYFKYQFVNVPGSTHQRGIELGISYDSGRVFGDLAYTHTNSDLPSQVPGLGTLNDLPDDIVSATAGARFFGQKLEVGGTLDYVSNGVTGDFAAAGADGAPAVVETDGYTLAGLFASYEVRKDVDVTFRVTNLFDKDYTPALSTIGSGQGRSFFLSTEFRF